MLRRFTDKISTRLLSRILEKIHCFDYLHAVTGIWQNERHLSILLYLVTILIVSLSSVSHQYTNTINEGQLDIRDSVILMQRFFSQIDSLRVLTPFVKAGVVTVDSPYPLQNAYRTYLLFTRYLGDIDSEIVTVKSFEDLDAKVKNDEIKKWQEIQRLGISKVKALQKIVDALFSVILFLQGIGAVFALQLGFLGGIGSRPK